MANSYNKQSRGLISNAFGVAKKLTNTGLDLLNHLAPGRVSKLSQIPEDHQIIEGQVKEKTMNENKQFENPQQVIREHVPKVTQQLLGRHYKKVNNVASFISPDLNNKIADYFFDKLDGFSSSVSSVDHVLKEVGAKSLDELATDSARSTRISVALANQNKLIAAIQGALTGATGVIGTAIDIPSSLVLTLRAIYQTGRAHGFELDRNSQQDIVEYVFKQVDLGTLAEKQTVLVALRALANVLETQNIQQLQSLLGSSNDFSVLQKWLSQEDGTLKWTWLNHIPKISILSKLTPLASAGVGAFYSVRLIEDANQKAEDIFASAQQYRLQHPNENFNILEAYEKSKALIADASPVLFKDAEPVAKNNLDLDSVIDQVDNDAIKEIRIEHKTDDNKAESESVAEGLKKLAETHVQTKTANNAKPDEVEGETVQKSSSSTAVKKTVVRKTTPAKTNTTNSTEAKTQTNGSNVQKTPVKKSPDATQAKGEAKVAAATPKRSPNAAKKVNVKEEGKNSSSLTKNEETPKTD